MVHVVPALGTVGLMLLGGLVLPALGNPVALAYGALTMLGLTLVKDRRLALALALLAAAALVLVILATGQPGYMELVRPSPDGRDGASG